MCSRTANGGFGGLAGHADDARDRRRADRMSTATVEPQTNPSRDRDGLGCGRIVGIPVVRNVGTSNLRDIIRKLACRVGWCEIQTPESMICESAKWNMCPLSRGRRGQNVNPG